MRSLNTVEHLRSFAAKGCVASIANPEIAAQSPHRSERTSCYLVRGQNSVWKLTPSLPSQGASAWIYYDSSGDAIMCWHDNFDGVRLVPPSPLV